MKMKKMYSKPVVEEMSIKETAAGGLNRTTHDGKIYQISNTQGELITVEEYYPASGERESENVR